MFKFNNKNTRTIADYWVKSLQMEKGEKILGTLGETYNETV